MTLTLFGRWQIRIILLATIGLLLTISIALKSSSIFAGQIFLTLIYLGLFGMAWDLVYHQLQRLRWDGDWNGLCQIGTVIWEGIFFGLMITAIELPGLDRATFNMIGFIGFYTILSLLNLLAANSLLRILSPYSRFNGGQWF